MSTLLTTLTSSIALMLNVLLIVLLVVRELLRGAQSPAMQRLRRLFGVACLPLLAVFIATVVIRLSTLADPTAAAQGSSTAVAAVVATPAPTALPIASSSATPAPVASPTTAVVPTGSPAATVTVVPPTATAAATATPLSTPTIAPTAPPSVRPSTSPAPTPTSVVVASQLDVPLSAWPTRDGATAQMGYANDRYQLVLTGQPNVGVASVLPADSYRTSIDVTIRQGEAGVVFLATEPATFYRVMINTEGAYAIQSLRNDQVRNVVNWTDSPALNGTTTRLRIERQGTTVQFSANDQPLTMFTVPDGPGSNQIGVALASDTDQGQATFSNLVVEKLSVAQ